jgi:tetratricopeptide (TPR) repeat protein
MTVSRPQPIGVLPLPAGWLVLPYGAGDAGARNGGELAECVEALLAGRLPDPWPPSLEPVRLAAAGTIEDAAALVDPAADDGGVSAYNHFVLTGEPSSLATARAAAATVADTDLAALVEIAAFSLGLPAELPDAGQLTGELAAHALAARAAAALERGDPQGALDALVAAESAAREVSPVLGALLLGQQAALLQQVNGADAEVINGYTEAVDALRGLDAVEPAMAELALGQATAYQELASQSGDGPGATGLLLEAVRTYHLALRLLRKESQPQRYAFAHSNLALAYLAMPMGDARDTLRRGVAVQSLREALTYYTREEYPAEWAAVTLNLANAMQHLPTTHPVENLIEAVGMYDELLTVRTRESDPLGHARVLANQGTALAHLGIHDQARAKLKTAAEIFGAFGESGAVATVEAALADIAAAERPVPVGEG